MRQPDFNSLQTHLTEDLKVAVKAEKDQRKADRRNDISDKTARREAKRERGALKSVITSLLHKNKSAPSVLQMDLPDGPSANKATNHAAISSQFAQG